MPGQEIVEVSQMVPLVVGLARAHYKRLRWYWEGCRTPFSNPNGSLTDAIDLELASVGLITRVPAHLSRGQGVCFTISDAGQRELAAERHREVLRRAPHHELGGRLASWLRDQGRVTWENIQFRVDINNPPALPGASPTSTAERLTVRPDVFSMAKTYDASRMNPCVHEVKVSRADFLADLAKPDKRKGYAHISEVLYYACPKELIGPEEVPPDCGLVYETALGEFGIIKKPKKRKVTLTAGHFMNLILKPGQFIPL